MGEKIREHQTKKAHTGPKNPEFKSGPKESKTIQEAKEKALRDIKLGILLTKATSRKDREELKKDVGENSLAKIKTERVDPEKYAQLNKDKNYFYYHFGAFNSKVSKWLSTLCPGFKNTLSISVIERESAYNIIAKSPTGADSYMQLTNDPFDDMKVKKGGRGVSYVKYFANIDDNVLSSIKDQNVHKGLSAFKKILQNNSDLENPKTKNHWNKMITYLEKNRKHQEINLIVGNIYLSQLRSEATDDKIDTEIKKLKSSPKIVKRFKSLLSEKGIHLENEDEARMALDKLIFRLTLKKNIRNEKGEIETKYINSELRKDFYALSRYNGDKKRDTGMEHKIMYAATVLVAKNLRDERKIA